jgi:chromosome partitioning protein
MEIEGRSDRTKFRNQVLRPLLDAGLIEMTIPDKPNQQQAKVSADEKSMELRYAIGVADRAYIPVQPFQFDIWTIRQMDTLVEMARGLNEELAAFIVLNRVATNPAIRKDKETREFITRDNFQHLTLAESMIRDRIAFRKAARDGLAVVEYGQDRKAVNEMNQLYEEIYGD